MKGMMVTLLVLLMTGMVVGQQATNPADSNQTVGRFILDMNDDLIGILTHEGYLRAPIQPGAINSIIQVEFRYANSRRDVEPVQITQVPSSEPRAMHFELSDADLRNLKERGLRYTLREADRGKYDVVVIDYSGFIGPRNNQAGAANDPPFTTQTRPVAARPNGVFDRQPFGTGQRERDNVRRDSNSLANNGSSTNSDFRRRTSNNFPTRDTVPQTRHENTPNRSTMSEFDRWAQQRKDTVADEAARLARETRENAQRALPTRNPLLPDNRTGFLDRDQPRGQDSRDIDYQRRLAQEQAQRDLEYDRDRNRQLGTGNNSRDIDYVDQWSNRDNNSRVRPVDIERLSEQQRNQAEQYALAAEQKRLENMKIAAEQLKKQRLQREIEDTQTEIANELHRKEMQDAVRRKRERERWAMAPGNTGYGFTDDKRPLINYPSNSYPDRRRQDFVDPMEDYDPDFDRIAQRTGARPTGPVPAAIGGPAQPITGAGGRTNVATNIPKGNDVVLADQTQLTRLNQQSKLLWFMLLCSLGLNIYLGWIARSFYGRYEELADELRETFTTTVA